MSAASEARKAISDESSPRLISLASAAKRLGVSYWCARDLIIAGTLPAVRLKMAPGRDVRRVLVDARDLDELIARSKIRNGR